MNRKVTVVGGAGNVGATVARAIATKELADVVIVDIADTKAAGIALDIYQSCPIDGSDTRLIGGSEAVQAATRTYWNIRVLCAPMMLANYVILGWLIGLGRAGYGLFLQLVLNSVNVILAVVLVHFYGLGVAGAAWAGFAAETSAALAGFVVVYRLVDRSALPDRAEILGRAAFVRLIALNRDILIRSFALLFAFAVFTARSADAGDVILAANEILMNLIIFAAYFLDGLAAAAEQLAGRALGARHRPAFDRATRLAILWGYAIGLTLTLILLAAGNGIVGVMTTSEPVREAARGVLVWAALFPLVGTLAYQMDGVFIGATWSVDMRNTMLLSLVIYLAAGTLLAIPFGIVGWWIALLAFLLVRGLSLAWRYRIRVGAAFPDAMLPR